jgi:hypothetical protein
LGTSRDRPDFRRPGRSATLRRSVANPDALPSSVEELLLRAEQIRRDAAAEKLRRELRRIGAGVAFSADRNAIRLVLAEADLTRHGRLHRRS